MLETDKDERHKADSAWLKGIFLGYTSRSTEYNIGTKDCVHKCRTARRRAEGLLYDLECADYLNITYGGFVLKGARSTPMICFSHGGGQEAPGLIPVRGCEFVPRRVYTRASDYVKHGFTEGCRGCTWAQNQLGPRAAHTEACRARLEGAMAADEDDDRTEKVQERQDNFAAQKVAQGDGDVKRCTDPPPEGAQKDAPIQDEEMNGAERFNIGSPSREKDRRRWP